MGYTAQGLTSSFVVGDIVYVHNTLTNAAILGNVTSVTWTTSTGVPGSFSYSVTYKPTTLNTTTVKVIVSPQSQTYSSATNISTFLDL